MENVMTVASYVCSRYQEAFGERIDEMKLHKLMYFAQRESLIRTGEPLFDAEFYGWRYGPVLRELRGAYKDNSFDPAVGQEAADRMKDVMDQVFEEYAHRDSISLSRLSHGEISWRRSRKGIAPDQNGTVAIQLEDIRLDADRIRQRRAMLDSYGIQ